MGTRPRPTAMRVLTGNPSKRPLPAHEPAPDALEEAVPPEVVEDTARAEWIRTIVVAIRCGMVTSTDRALAIAHCRLWSRWVAQMNRRDNGGAGKTLALLIRVDIELGLTPTARTKVQAVAPKVRKDNPLSKYLQSS